MFAFKLDIMYVCECAQVTQIHELIDFAEMKIFNDEKERKGEHNGEEKMFKLHLISTFQTRKIRMLENRISRKMQTKFNLYFFSRLK